MALPTRDLKITYGTLVLGGTSASYYLDAPIRFAIGPDMAMVEADVVVVGTSESAFRTACVNLETAFKTPRQFLEVKFGSAVHETFDHTNGVNTGFNQSPSIAKIGSDEDTGRSRRYHVSVAVQLPADAYTDSGGASTDARRNATVTLYTSDSGRRRCSITGQYTASATSGNGARAQYNAKITTYITAITTAFTGVWEVIFDPQVSTDDQDKVCNFSLVLEEVIFRQSDVATDDATLRRPHLTITRSQDTSGDSVIFGLKPQRFQRVSIDYSASVDKAVTQDLKGTYASLVRPYLVTLAQQAADTANGFIESEMPTFDPVENRLAVRMAFVSYPGGTLLAARVTTDESYSTGITLMAVWSKQRDRLKKRRFDGPGALTRTVTAVVTEVGTPGSPSILHEWEEGWEDDQVVISDSDENKGLAMLGGVPQISTSPDGGELKRIFLGAGRSTSPRRIGPVNGETVDVVDRVYVARYEYFVDASPG
jgi:hypothetical protein